MQKHYHFKPLSKYRWVLQDPRTLRALLFYETFFTQRHLMFYVTFVSIHCSVCIYHMLL